MYDDESFKRQKKNHYIEGIISKNYSGFVKELRSVELEQHKSSVRRVITKSRRISIGSDNNFTS